MTTQLAHKNKRITDNNYLVFIIEFLGLMLFAVLFFIYLGYIDLKPSGIDLWGHIYRADVVYESVKNGVFYPLFDMNWYNGTELFRSWGIGSYYFYLIPNFISSGDVVLAYRLFLCMMIVLAGIPWIILGINTNCKTLGFIISILWYSFPVIEHFTIYQGNVSFIVCIMYMPYLFLFLKLYLDKKIDAAAIGLVIIMSLMTVTHLMITGITGVSTFIYLLIDYFYNKDFKRKFSSLVYMVFGIGLMAIWVIPAISSGSMGNLGYGNEAAAAYVTKFSVLIDPIHRIVSGGLYFYSGLFIFLISIFGIIASNKKNKAGFIFFILILVAITPAAFSIISHLPLSGVFLMIRFAPISYGFFVLSIFDWTSIKKKYFALIILLITLDCLPFYTVNLNRLNVSEEAYSVSTFATMFGGNRTSLLDESGYGAYPSYAIPESGSGYTFGWSSQGAVTARNITLVNEACHNGDFLYVFDRSLELGDDEVIIPKNYVPLYLYDYMIESANRSGYTLTASNDYCYVFNLSTIDLGHPFGTITTYKAISIGSYAYTMTTKYPAFGYGESIYIDDYSFEELSSYEVLFLTGFEYHDKTVAENLLKDLSENGTRIIIDASHLPKDREKNEPYFLGVSSYTIEFHNRFPSLHINGEVLNAADFNEDYSDFRTSYFQGASNVIGYVYVGDTVIPFLGNNNDYPEIYFVGLNIIFEATDADDEVLYSIVDDLFGFSRDELPERRVVPIDVSYDYSGLVITSPEDNLNTSITYLETFVPDREVRNSNNLMVVDAGTTNIRAVYPMLKKGMIASFVCLLLLVVWIIVERKFKLSASSND